MIKRQFDSKQEIRRECREITGEIIGMLYKRVAVSMPGGNADYDAEFASPTLGWHLRIRRVDMMGYGRPFRIDAWRFKPDGTVDYHCEGFTTYDIMDLIL